MTNEVMMKSFKLLILLSFGLLSLPANSWAQSPDVEWSETSGTTSATVSWMIKLDEGGTLVIRHFAGDVTVQGVNTEAIALKYGFSSDLRFESQDEAQKTLQRSIPSVKTAEQTVTVQGSSYSLRGSTGTHSLHVQLPKGTSIEINLLGGSAKMQNTIGDVDAVIKGGNLTLKGVQGGITLASKGGNIELSDVIGPLNAVTNGGHIRASRVDGDCELRSTGGGIFLESITGNLAASAHGGMIEVVDLDGAEMQLSATQGSLEGKQIRLSGSGEMISSAGSVRLEDSEGDLKLISAAGDVYSEKHRGALRAETDAGNIEALNLTGSVNAATSVGDIEVSLSGVTKQGIHKVELKTGLGNVDLLIPSEIGAYVEATVGPEGASEGSIRSEYPLTRRVQSNVRATAYGEVNGGGIPVLLYSRSGRITIRK